MRKKRKTVWAFLDGKKLVDVVQAALDNNMMVDDLKAKLIAENPGHEVMCFEYGTEKEAKTKLSTVSSHKRKWNEKNPKKYDAYRVGNCIYIVRLTGKKG